MSTETQTQVVMPQMGVSVSEGTITKWLKQVGDAIAQDEPLLEISTDKVDTEVPSPGEGIVQQILVPEGETVEVGTVLALIGPAGSQPAEAAPPAAPAAAPEPTPEPEPAAAPPAPEPAAEPAPVAAAPPAPAAAAQPAPSGNGKSFVSPVVARIAAEHGVDPASVPGTGAGGRVTKKDIMAFIESGAAAASIAPSAPAEPAPAPAEPVAAAPPPAPLRPHPHPRRPSPSSHHLRRRPSLPLLQLRLRQHHLHPRPTRAKRVSSRARRSSR